MSYSPLFLNFWQVGLGFGKLDFILVYQGHRICIGKSHIGGGHALSPGSWMILPRSCQDGFPACNLLVVCICYCLRGSLVAMRNHGTHALTVFRLYMLVGLA